MLYEKYVAQVSVCNKHLLTILLFCVLKIWAPQCTWNESFEFLPAKCHKVMGQDNVNEWRGNY